MACRARAFSRLATFGQRRALATAAPAAAPRPPLQLYRSLWGVDGVDNKDQRSELFSQIKKDGYFGVESGPFIIATGGVAKWEPDPRDDAGRNAFAEALRENGLSFIAMVHSAGYPVDGRLGVDKHLESVRIQAEVALEMGAEMINVHGGRDAWSTKNAIKFLAGVAELEAELGVPFVLETHRQRLFWTPWQTRHLMLTCDHHKIPIKLNADLSHWCAGGERIFSDDFDPEFKDIIAMVAERALLIHARVGWSQGPQVPDPRLPEYSTELAAHEGWWDVILDGMVQRGVPPRLEPEFGPAPYMPVNPKTKENASDLWAINSFIAKRQLQRWEHR